MYLLKVCSQPVKNISLHVDKVENPLCSAALRARPTVNLAQPE